jgi:hypothetical protein
MCERREGADPLGWMCERREGADPGQDASTTRRAEISDVVFGDPVRRQSRLV